MGTVILVIFLLGVSAAVEGYLLARQKRWGEMAASLLLWIVAITYAAAVVGVRNLLNPTQILLAIRDYLSTLVS